MKKTTNTFTFNFSPNGQENITISLPKKFEDIFNKLSTTTDGSNSILELSRFCEEYANLSSNEQAMFQQAITSGNFNSRLNSFNDLRALIKSIEILIV